LDCLFNPVGSHFQSAGLRYHVLEVSGPLALSPLVQSSARAFWPCEEGDNKR
jgi:hypothetical protein